MLFSIIHRSCNDIANNLFMLIELMCLYKHRFIYSIYLSIFDNIDRNRRQKIMRSNEQRQFNTCSNRGAKL
jgi:hypothetical protein